MAVSALACLSCCTANAAIFFHGATDGSGTKRIRIEGEISDGDANRFAEFVRRENANEHTIFHLNSPGGSVLEAERIASKIHRLGASLVSILVIRALRLVFLCSPLGLQDTPEKTPS